MKRGKEIKLDLPHQYNVISGTVDNKNPRSLYIQISSWGKPKEKYIDDYEPIIKQKSKRVKRKLFEILDENSFYKNMSIVDFNMASSGIDYNKRSYMSVEVTLFKKEPLLPINSEKMIPIVKDISEKLIKGVFEVDETFKFYKRKK
jgi:AAA+ ATPase superfamily predicted ATPase